MRLFVAIDPPAAERARIDRLARPLRELGMPIRWVAPEAYHLTLKFLGEVEQERTEELVEAMREAVSGEVPFDLELGGLGAAPSLARPKVVWIEIPGDPALARIQAGLEEAFAARGFPKEERPFRPHLTLGRVRRRSRADELTAIGALALELDFSGPAFPVRSLALMESEQTDTGARYRVVFRLPLAAPD